MKKSLGKKTILYTHPVLMVGSYSADGVADLMAASWGGICCSEPPLVTVSIRKQRQTYDNIMHNQAFTINMPTVKYVRESDFCGVISGKQADKFHATGLTAIKSELVNAPLVKEFPLALICKLYKTLELGTHTQFIGEILDAVADEEVLSEKGMPLIEKIQPFFYDSPSQHYYGIGEQLIEAYTTMIL